MRIEAITVQDFKGIKRVRRRLDRTWVVVRGKNGAGKTSLLDAIECVLAGKNASPGAPVRRGADEAKAELDLGDLVATRRWYDDGARSDLTVKYRGDRRAVTNPQQVVERLFSRVAFDPFQFAKMEPSRQAQVLRKLSGREDEILAVEAQARELDDERKDCHKAVKADEAVVSEYGSATEYEGVPDEEVSAEDVIAEHKEILNRKARNLEVRRTAEVAHALLRDAKTAVLGRREAYRRNEETIARLMKENAGLSVEINDGEREVDRLTFAEQAARAAAESLVEPDLGGVERKMRERDSVNARVRRKRERAAVADRLADNAATLTDLTAKIGALAAKRNRLLASSKIPVEGLGIDRNVVTLRGVPLGQCSHTEQVLTGLWIAAAQSPELRTVLVRDASVIDRANLELMHTWADENDYQVLLEFNGPPEGDGELVIEDGLAVDDEAAGGDDDVRAEDLPGQAKLF